MRTQSLVAVVVLAFLCVLSASCLQGNAEADAPASPAPSTSGPGDAEHLGEAQEEAGGRPYESRDFHFEVDREDDGEDKGGGWQIAKLSDRFSVGLWRPYRWTCQHNVEMPLRTEKLGHITASRAALWSAEAANAVVFPLLDSDAWGGVAALFCKMLDEQLKAKLDTEHKGLGARVVKR